MTMNAEQMRKKSIAEQESLRHHRYAQADGSMKKGNSEPMNSPAIHSAVARVNAATEAERESIGAQDPSPNASIRFGGGY
jgi:nucleoside diphosphate kinase